MFLFPSCNCEKSKMKRLFVGVFTSELWPRPPSLPGRLPWGCSEGGPDPRLRDKGQRPRVSDRLEENGWTNPVPSPAGRRPCQGWRRAGGAAGLQPCAGSSAHAPPRTSRRGLCVVGCGREPHGHLSGPPSAPRPRLQHHRTRAAASGTQVPGGRRGDISEPPSDSGPPRFLQRPIRVEQLLLQNSVCLRIRFVQGLCFILPHSRKSETHPMKWRPASRGWSLTQPRRRGRPRPLKSPPRHPGPPVTQLRS